MASVGHSLTQAPQATQDSVMMWAMVGLQNGQLKIR
jgi:hypothetical protein